MSSNRPFQKEEVSGQGFMEDSFFGKMSFKCGRYKIHISVQYPLPLETKMIVQAEVPDRTHRERLHSRGRHHIGRTCGSRTALILEDPISICARDFSIPR